MEQKTRKDSLNIVVQRSLPKKEIMLLNEYINWSSLFTSKVCQGVLSYAISQDLRKKTLIHLKQE